MSDSTDRIVALKAVIDLVQPDVAPTLTQGEVELEVDRAKLVKTWTVSTAYNIEDVVVPAIRNGHAYECIQPGTSQSGAKAYEDWSICTGARMADGSSSPQLIWREVGTDRFNPRIFGAERNIYDIEWAAKKLARIKMTRSAQMVNDGDVSFEQLYEHWKEQWGYFRPFRRPIELVRC